MTYKLEDRIESTAFFALKLGILTLFLTVLIKLIEGLAK